MISSQSLWSESTDAKYPSNYFSPTDNTANLKMTKIEVGNFKFPISFWQKGLVTGPNNQQLPNRANIKIKEEYDKRKTKGTAFQFLRESLKFRNVDSDHPSS